MSSWDSGAKATKSSMAPPLLDREVHDGEVTAKHVGFAGEPRVEFESTGGGPLRETAEDAGAYIRNVVNDSFADSESDSGSDTDSVVAGGARARKPASSKPGVAISHAVLLLTTIVVTALGTIPM